MFTTLLESLMAIVMSLILLIVGVVVLVAAIALLVQLTRFLWREPKVIVGDFHMDGEANTAFANKYYDRWVTCRAGDTAANVFPFPMGGIGFIMAAVERRSTTELEQALGDLGNELDLKLGGVSVQIVLRVLDAITRPASRVIDGRLSRYTGETSLVVTLRQGDLVEKDWVFSRARTPNEDQEASYEDLLEPAIWTVAKHLSEVDDARAGAQRRRRLAYVRDRPLAALATGILWLGLGVLTWNEAVLFLRGTGYLWRAREAVVGDFEVDGDASPAFAKRFYDSWTALRTAGDSLRRPITPLPFRVDSDFVSAEVERRSGAQLERALGNLGKELDLKLAGANAQGLVQCLDVLSLRPRRGIEGSLRHAPGEIILTITLLKDENPERVWSLSSTVGGDGGANEARALAEEKLLDEAVAQVALYLLHGDPDPADQGEKTMAGPTTDLNASALADLTRGRRSLERYVKTNKQADLMDAQKHFRSLVEHSPAYTDGYLMLSYALAENRQEREAIEIYDQALQLLGTAMPPEEQRLFEARFLKASSLLRCYRWAETVQAIGEFRALAVSLKGKCAEKKPADSQKEPLRKWHENHNMLARTYLETAHCFGHLLVHLPKDRSIRTDHYLDDVKTLLGPSAVQLADPDTLKDRRTVADLLYAKAKEYQTQTQAVQPIYMSEWKADLASRLSEVRGYAQYRHAEWLPATDDTQFKKQCAEAVRSLQDAELRRLQHYALLQNIGMVYLNRRYDPRGDDLATSERYFQRSIELKPGDYYGFEQLARISLRRALLGDEAAQRTAALKTGNDRAAEALKLLPESRGVAMVRFYLRLAKVAFDGPKASADEIDGLVNDLDRRDPATQDLALRWMRLACEWFHLVAATDEAAFNAGKDALKPMLDTFLAGVDSDQDVLWRVAQMRSSIKALREQLESVTFKTRQKTRLELAAALD
jgi:hypothetical protein